MCLVEASQWRKEIAFHVAYLVRECPPGAVDVHGLGRDEHLDELHAMPLTFGWPMTHAVVLALTTGQRVITVEPERYAGTGADAIAL
jgi:hypothetical protein